MTDSPVETGPAPKSKKNVKALKTTAKVFIITAVLFGALLIGLAIGYQFITKTSGLNIFRLEIWRKFFQQIRALR